MSVSAGTKGEQVKWDVHAASGETAETQLMGSVLKVPKRILCGMSQEKVWSWIFMCCLCWQLFNF